MAYHKYKQGIFIPQYPEKYVGNKKPTYRSGMEQKFMRWCDSNPNVLRWTSETVVVPYRSPVDHKMHRYFIDNAVSIKEGDKTAYYLVEIKPACQTTKPTKHGNKKESTILYEQATWLVNESKWEAAKKFADERGWKFIIITENELP